MTTTWGETVKAEVELPTSPGEVQELLRPALVRVSGLSIAASYGWFLWGLVAGDKDANWWMAAPSVMAGLSSALALVLARQYRIAVGIVVGGLSAAALVDAVVGGGLVGHWLALTTILAAGVLAGPVMTLVLGTAVAILAAVLVPWPGSWPLLRSAFTGVVLVWAVGGSLFEALRRAERGEMRAWRHAEEAMRRRGDLQRTSKALRDMYALLERTNRELEIARREAEEAREIKARFAASISHELRTPLNVILGFSRIMYRSPRVYGDVNWTPELRADVRQIYNASRHLLDMIDDILDLARIEAQRLPLKLERVDLAQLIHEAADTARGLLRDSEVALVVDVPPEVPEMMLDGTRIRQVLLNLLSNAIRFTDSGQIVVSVRVDDSQVHVAVADTGVGIAPGDLATVFDEFSQAGSDVTAGRGGAGLGLAVCKQFVQLHGGRIRAESQPGRGSRFEFSLPRAQARGGRARLAYYAPEGWSPPLPEDSAGDCVVVLSSHESAGRVVARGVADCRVLPLSDLRALPALVEAEHPLGVVILRDPLAGGEGPSAEDIWAVTGRPDLGVVECEVPLEEAARRSLGVDVYLTKPVQPEEVAEAIRRVRPGAARLLVVDDDASFLALLERMLKLTLPEADVRTCEDGSDALRLAREQEFDLVILDLAMPQLGGVAFLQKVREERLLADAGFIVTTGAPYVEELAAAYPTRMYFARKAPPRSDRWLGCITAVLAAVPPDYSIPAPAPALPATARP
ncbi:MAG: hybrid sensor histidine kinase/response regulator [Anaerolineae bacterium]|nr:hybrid sensor histidine kinase/response regulator [Anaerolineae bacterium]